MLYWPTVEPLLVRPMPSRYRPVAAFSIRTVVEVPLQLVVPALELVPTRTGRG